MCILAPQSSLCFVVSLNGWNIGIGQLCDKIGLHAEMIQ